MRTQVAFLLDETGSMAFVKDSTIEGYNLYVKGLQDDPDNKYRFTMVKFDSNHITTVWNGVKIKKVVPLTSETYTPDAWTPLYDAVVHTIGEVKAKDKQKVIAVIMTDGAENSSKKYSLEDVQELIAEKQKEGWAFVFLGANQDAWGTATSFGISTGSAGTYTPGQEKAVMTFASMATRSFSSGASAESLMENMTDKEGNIEEEK